MKGKINYITSSGVSLSNLLFLIFLVLKLTHQIDWSWWWVTSPLWLPIALSISFLFIVGIISFILNIIFN
jgi:hypothetical protein